MENENFVPVPDIDPIAYMIDGNYKPLLDVFVIKQRNFNMAQVKAIKTIGKAFIWDYSPQLRAEMNICPDEKTIDWYPTQEYLRLLDVAYRDLTNANYDIDPRGPVEQNMLIAEHLRKCYRRMVYIYLQLVSVLIDFEATKVESN